MCSVYCVRRGGSKSCFCTLVFFFQAEDGIRDLVRSRGLGDVYKRQVWEQGPILGLGTRVGPFWYPEPFLPPTVLPGQ